jgi:GT2 family glycosyltransferase
MQNIVAAKTGVITLNWNGWQDTIECLNSLLEMDTQDFCVFIVDNNSSDESVEKIISFISNRGLENRFYLIQQTENLGFARGSNAGIKLALECNFEFVWLLNNDTIVERNTLSELLSFFDKHSSYSIITPAINYHSKKEIIWNCGGKISQLGYRKYFFAGEQESNLPEKEFLDISFITNCASLFRKSYFEKYGLLTEKFFFGEEDFEMCLRAKKEKIKIACVLTTKIYHKVSSSITKISPSDDLKKIHIHYLNRLIDMKIYFNAMPFFLAFILIHGSYVFFLLLKKGNNPAKILSLLMSIISKSFILNSVDKEDFMKIME